MRIANPPQQIPTSIAISSPASITSTTQTSLADNSSLVIAAVSNQREVIIANNETAGAFFAGASAGAYTQNGVPVNFGGVLTLTTASNVRLSNNSGGAIRLSYLQTSG